jgi:hypothetical protein
MEVSGARMASNRLATIARHLSPTPSSLSFMVHMDKLLASFSLYGSITECGLRSVRFDLLYSVVRVTWDLKGVFG